MINLVVEHENERLESVIFKTNDFFEIEQKVKSVLSFFADFSKEKKHLKTFLTIKTKFDFYFEVNYDFNFDCFDIKMLNECTDLILSSFENNLEDTAMYLSQILIYFKKGDL